MTAASTTNGRMTAEGAELRVRIVHASPGRLRLRVGREAVNGGALGRAERALAEVRGVEAIQRSPVTGSVLLRYTPGTVDLPDVLTAIEKAGVEIIVEDTPSGDGEKSSGERPTLGDTISGFFQRADARVADATHGRADLKTLVPVGLGALAVRELLAGRAIAAPWYVLAWYAFDSFTKLRRPDTPSDSVRP